MNGIWMIGGIGFLGVLFTFLHTNKIKNQRFLFLLGIASFLLISCSGTTTHTKDEKKSGSTAASSQDALKGTRFTTKVTRVTDGDTFHITVNGKDETVRLLLIDTPETHKPNTPVQPFGPEAEAFTRKMIEGKTVEIERDAGGDARDKYGRLLYYVYVDGKSVQEELLRQGLARVAYIYPPNIKYVDQYKTIQSEAQKKGIGIWSIENYAKDDGYHPEVTGKISSTSQQSPQQPKSDKLMIKGNINNSGEKIYHVPGSAFYDKTVAEEWFNTEEEAKVAGYRPAKN